MDPINAKEASGDSSTANGTSILFDSPNGYPTRHCFKETSICDVSICLTDHPKSMSKTAHYETTPDL